MSKRTRISSGVQWESAVGYSRAVRTGNQIFVSGTTATLADGSVGGLNDEYEQTRIALTNLASALMQAGATMADVVRTRMFVTNIANWKAVGRAHGEVFGDIRPATSMLQVSALIDPAMLVEIEADAVIEE